MITAGSSEPYTFDLPKPPSVNKFEAKLGNASPVVQKWIKNADGFVMAYAPKPRPHIKGAFELRLTWSSSNFTHDDVDNRIKATLDYLERLELIENDRFCCKVTAEFGQAPEGCRVTLIPRPDVECPMPSQRPTSCQSKTKLSRRVNRGGRRFAKRQLPTAG